MIPFSKPSGKWFYRVLLIILCLILVGVQMPVINTRAEGLGSATYLPIVLNKYPYPQVTGVEVGSLSNGQVNAMASQATVYWYRVGAFRWDLIQPNQAGDPLYDWSSVDESGITYAASQGLQLIATIRFSPSWARNDPHLCAAIKPEALASYAQFLSALVSRYSAPPYNVHYWELGNEPDVDPNLLSDVNSVFGCWGNSSDPYYGGGYYATMLQAAYPAIKAADPSAKVLIGGLLLDCDPGDPSCTNPVSPKFFEGILKGGGASYFDIVSFHGYPVYTTTTTGNPIAAELNFQKWANRGGVVMGKVNYLKQLMATYGTSKPVFLTEGALLCPEWSPATCTNPSQDFYNDQAAYLVWLFARNWAEGIMGTTWYTLDGPGYRYSGLLDASQQPLPGYFALKKFNEKLGWATYISKVTKYDPLIGYEFASGIKTIDVLASPDNSTYSITVPGNMVAYDVLGHLIASAGQTASVSTVIYLETIQ